MDRSVQIKYKVANNTSGPLDRSIKEQVMQKDDTHLEKRVLELENHLRLAHSPTSLETRVSRLEQWILELEQKLPAFCAFYFNYDHTDLNTTWEPTATIGQVTYAFMGM